MLSDNASRASRVLIFSAAVIFFSTLPLAQGQGYVWARRLGSTQSLAETAYGVATGSGGVYIGGDTAGAVAGQPNPSAGGNDAFVAKYDPAGTRLWVRQFGTSANDSVKAVAADSSGVYLAGVTQGGLSGSSLGASDAFVRKYDPNGNELWTRQFGTASDDQALGIASDGTGVYVVGKTAGILPGQSQTTPNGDPFIRKYDSSGNELWTRQFGTSDQDEATAVAADTSGIYITGRTNGVLAPPGQGGFDAFLRKYDASGNVVWTRQFGTNTTDAAYAVAVNASGVYVGGETAGTFPGFTKAGGLYDAFAAKFDLAGNQQWLRQLGTQYEDAVYGIATSTAGIYFVGYAGDPFPGQPDGGAFVRRYDANGNETGTVQFATGVRDNAYAAAADGSGVYVGGDVNGGSTAFGPRPEVFPGTDAIVFKIPNPPDVSEGGVVNNGSFAVSPAPVASGSIAAVFGTNLNDGTFVLGSSFGANGRLVTTLGGSSATVNNIPTPMFYSTPGQLGIQIPFEVTGGTATIRVTVAGQTSVPRTFAVDTVAPGIFTTTNDGKGTAALLHQDGVTPVTAQNPAKPNEVVISFLTGLGALSPALQTGEPAALNRVGNPVLTVDEAAAEILFAGAAPGFVGLNQINFRIPPNTRTGAAIPVRLTANGKQSNAVTIPVGP
jgi:uncharacterized protein (TIGR03437 family)